MDMVSKALSPAEIARLQAGAPAAIPPAAGGKEPPKFVAGPERSYTVPLEFPVEYDGVTYHGVTIRRPLMREWRAYLRACADAVNVGGPGADDLVDQVWLSIPAIVLESLDFADASRVEEAMEGFFGRSGLPDGTDDNSTSSSGTGDPSPSP